MAGFVQPGAPNGSRFQRFTGFRLVDRDGAEQEQADAGFRQQLVLCRRRPGCCVRSAGFVHAVGQQVLNAVQDVNFQVLSPTFSRLDFRTKPKVRCCTSRIGISAPGFR